MRTHRSLKKIKGEIKKLNTAKKLREMLAFGGVLSPSADPAGKARSATPPYMVLRPWRHLDREIARQQEAMVRIKTRLSRSKHKVVTQAQKSGEKGKKKDKGKGRQAS